MDGALVNQSTHEESLVGSRILFPDGLAVALYHDAAGLGGSWGAVQAVVARGGLWRHYAIFPLSHTRRWREITMRMCQFEVTHPHYMNKSVLFLN